MTKRRKHIIGITAQQAQNIRQNPYGSRPGRSGCRRLAWYQDFCIKPGCGFESPYWRQAILLGIDSNHPGHQDWSPWNATTWITKHPDSLRHRASHYYESGGFYNWPAGPSSERMALVIATGPEGIIHVGVREPMDFPLRPSPADISEILTRAAHRVISAKIQEVISIMDKGSGYVNANLLWFNWLQDLQKVISIRHPISNIPPRVNLLVNTSNRTLSPMELPSQVMATNIIVSKRGEPQKRKP